MTQFTDDAIFVINGFYLLNREKFTAKGKVVHYYVVEWNESDLAWVDFRGKVIGPTNPNDAPSDSLRGSILKDWEALELAEAPTVSDNGVHASAGPLEGLVERNVWLGATLEEDAFAKAVLHAGGDAALLTQWMSNPSVTLGDQKAPVFDLLEDLQTSEVVSIMAEYYQQSTQTTARCFGDDEKDKEEDDNVPQPVEVHRVKEVITMDSAEKKKKKSDDDEHNDKQDQEQEQEKPARQSTSKTATIAPEATTTTV